MPDDQHARIEAVVELDLDASLEQEVAADPHQNRGRGERRLARGGIHEPVGLPTGREPQTGRVDIDARRFAEHKHGVRKERVQ